MRNYVIGFFEVAFWVGILSATVWLGTKENDWSTAGMLLLVCAAFTFFTVFAYHYTWIGHNALPIPEDTLRRAAAGRTVKVGGVELLPADATETVLSSIDTAAPPSWLGLGQNVLVSLGLVGTFLGLTIGIYSAAAGILSPDPNEVQEAMGVLMGGAKLAFAKSLAGVVAAMIWSFRHGQLEDLWAERRAQARAWIEATFPPLSSERLLAMTLTHLEATTTQHAARQTALKDEVVSAGTTLSKILMRLDSVEGTLAKRLGAVEEAVRAPGEDDVVTTLGALRNTVSQLADALPERMGAPIAGGISSALAASLNPKLDDVAKGIRALSDARGGIEQRVGAQVSGQVTELGGALATLQSAVVELKNQLIDLPSHVQTEVTKGTDTASQKLSRELVDAGKKVAEHLSGAATDLVTGSQKITESVSDLQTALGDSKAMADALRGAGEATATSLKGVQTPINDAADRVTNANLALVKATQNVSQVATIIATEEPKLRAAWQAEREAAERLLQSTQAAQAPLEALVKQVETLRTGCADLVSVIKTSGTDHTTAAKEAGDRLADAISDFKEGLAAITQTLNTQSGNLFEEAAQRAAKAAATVGDALKSGAEGFEESMDRMVKRSESIEEIFVRLDELAQNLTTAAEPLERAGTSLSGAVPALEAAQNNLEIERNQLVLLSDAFKESTAAVESILKETQQVRSMLDKDIPTRLAELGQARSALEQEWKQAGAERERAWTESARQLTEHVRALKQANADVAAAWKAAEQARTASIDQNAREIAQYAERVNQAIRLPQRLTDLNQTVEELVAVLDEIKRSARGPT